MFNNSQLKRSKEIQRTTGRTFYFATLLLPKRIRHATYVLYAFFRIADDVVDDPNPPAPTVQKEELERILHEALGDTEPTDPVLEAFQTIRHQYDIPDSEIKEFIAAMEQDVTPDEFATHDELDDYLRGSSVAVAYMMLAVIDPENHDAARPHAKALGEAFQLTNFLRDVREDITEYDRIYLPQSALRDHGVQEEQIRQLEFDEKFAMMMEQELQRTERLYAHGVAGIDLLPQSSQFAVLLAAILYGDHHRLIRKQGYDVLSHRPTLSLYRRVSLLIQTVWHWRRTGDPERTFEIVSAIGSPNTHSDETEMPGREHGWVDQVRTEINGGVLNAIRSRIPIGGAK